MWCRIYTAEGQLVTEGVRGVRRDGTLELVPLRGLRALLPGEGPLLVVEGRRHYPVRVTALHVSPDAVPAAAGAAVYHLAPLITD